MAMFQKGPLSGINPAGIGRLQAGYNAWRSSQEPPAAPKYSSAQLPTPGNPNPWAQPPQQAPQQQQNPYGLGSFDWGGFLQGLQGLFPNFSQPQQGGQQGGFGNMLASMPNPNYQPSGGQQPLQGMGGGMTQQQPMAGGGYSGNVPAPGGVNFLGSGGGARPGMNIPGMGTGVRTAHTLPLQVQRTY